MEDEEETLCRYGTALPAFEEDAVPSKKPITVADQIVLDSNGKRRFHGAFTGGFSAGYWNTVGSEEGWKPREFKSSRSEKSSTLTQNPMDFMDEEDVGEFGFAPQRVQPKDDFAHSNCSTSGFTGEKTNKRRYGIDMSFPNGPIPGQPVLGALLVATKEKTAIKILKNMGWREGQGIGERQTKTEKKRTKERNSKEQYIMKKYGCELPSSPPESSNYQESSESSNSDSDCDDITFAPDDFDPLVSALKDNTFGLGYSGLDRGSAKGHNLFDTFEVVDKNNKKLSIRGQAFGIGALEDDDDLDVYARDDMTRYDFSLEQGKQMRTNLSAIKPDQQGNSLEGFCSMNKVQKQVKKVFRSQMPEGFKPRNWEERRSRFEQMDEERYSKIHLENEHKIRGLGRHDLGPVERRKILGENELESSLKTINMQNSTFVTAQIINEKNSDEREQSKEDGKEKIQVAGPTGLVKQPNVLLQQYVGSTEKGFKPFIANADKQERYESFLAFQPTERYLTREKYLDSLQPLNFSAWEREREFKEFIQAELMYRPLDGLMSHRFVTASSLIADKTISKEEVKEPLVVQMRRMRTMWRPHKDLCKQFNVPEPLGVICQESTDNKQKKEKGKYSVFDYLETAMTNRRDFITPTIMPSTTHRTNVQPTAGNVGGERLSSKDFFVTDESLITKKVCEKADPTVFDTTVDRILTSTKKVEKKRSELEEEVIKATNKRPEEKRDLFKSIFCSSDEETDVANVLEDNKSQKVVLTDEEKLRMVDSIVAVKPANQVNILRNNSPPRGVFKSLFQFTKPQKSEPPNEGSLPITDAHKEVEKGNNSTSATDSKSSKEAVPASASYYGPKLPTVDTTPQPSHDGQQEQLDDRLRHLLSAGDLETTRKRETWIEKTADRHSSGRSKKKKKSKEHHHKSKSKSKHKKDKKKSSHNHKSHKR